MKMFGYNHFSNFTLRCTLVASVKVYGVKLHEQEVFKFVMVVEEISNAVSKTSALINKGVDVVSGTTAKIQNLNEETQKRVEKVDSLIDSADTKLDNLNSRTTNLIRKTDHLIDSSEATLVSVNRGVSVFIAACLFNIFNKFPSGSNVMTKRFGLAGAALGAGLFLAYQPRFSLKPVPTSQSDTATKQ